MWQLLQSCESTTCDRPQYDCYLWNMASMSDKQSKSKDSSIRRYRGPSPDHHAAPPPPPTPGHARLGPRRKTRSELEYEVKVISIEYKYKMFVAMLVAISFCWACYYFEQGFEAFVNQRVTWPETTQKIVMTVIAFLGAALVSPSIIFLKISVGLKTIVRRWPARTAEMERRLDPNRESSGLRQDGTDPS